MSPVPVSPRRVFGVDFSGARDAGRYIWVCRGHPGSDGVRVESVDPLAELPGGAADREPALRVLVQKITESPRSAWGFDFPFALPRPVADALADAAPAGFADQVEGVARLGDPDSFRERCRAANPGAELRRQTDDDAATPFSPYNLRMYKQTFYGMLGVLRPLRSHREIAVLPFDHLPEPTGSGERLPFNRQSRGRVPHTYLLEVCPASLLKVLDYPHDRYKGSDESRGKAREALLRRLIDDGLVRPMARALRTRIVDDAGGDGLDSVLAAVSAWRGYRTHDHGAYRVDPHYGLEGFVYT